MAVPDLQAREKTLFNGLPPTDPQTWLSGDQLALRVLRMAEKLRPVTLLRQLHLGRAYDWNGNCKFVDKDTILLDII